MTQYVAGDRVWVQMDGFPWWPARVITRENLQSLMEANDDPELDLNLLFYSGLQTAESVLQLSSRRDAHRVCFFEASSEKAVVSDPDLAEAIRRASEDATANPIRTENTAGAGAVSGTHGQPTHDAAVSRSTVEDASRKRAREADESTALPAYYHFLEDRDLKNVAKALEEAIAENNVGAVRRELLRLDRVDVTLTQLRATRVGVAVGNVKKSQACQPLWPLARAIISLWARNLPTETIRALKELQGQQNALPLGVAGTAELQYPTSPTGLLSPQSVTSPGGRQSAFSPSNAAVGSTTTADSTRQRRLGFNEQLSQLLNNPLSTKVYPESRINAVIQDIRQQMVDEDDRLELLVRLRTEEIAGPIRDGFLSGEWTVKQYLAKPRESFKTQQEIDDVERRVKENIAAEESAKNASLNITAMFECPECHVRHATFTETQTRGADEPTTKFITCLECHKTWIEE